jgi:hypothetical protein
MTICDLPNYAPPPNRRLPSAFGSLGGIVYHVCAPSAIPAAVGEARRSLKE